MLVIGGIIGFLLKSVKSLPIFFSLDQRTKFAFLIIVDH